MRGFPLFPGATSNNIENEMWAFPLFSEQCRLTFKNFHATNVKLNTSTQSVSSSFTRLNRNESNAEINFQDSEKENATSKNRRIPTRGKFMGMHFVSLKVVNRKKIYFSVSILSPLKKNTVEASPAEEKIRISIY